MNKKLISIFLALIMSVSAFSVIPLTAAATEVKTENVGYTESRSNETADSDFEFVFDEGETTLTGYNGNATQLVIPSEIEGCTITYIGPWAFSENTRITSVTIPDTVIRIETHAFSDCTNLKSVTIPDSVTSIYNLAFGGCTNLKTITIPSSVKEIGKRAFGYRWNESILNFEKFDDITICGSSGSAAETYAKENNFKFVSIDKFEIKGDLNDDGVLNIEDATYLQRVLAQTYTLTAEQKLIADINGDGIVDINDVTAIQRFAAGY